MACSFVPKTSGKYCQSAGEKCKQDILIFQSMNRLWLIRGVVEWGRALRL